MQQHKIGERVNLLTFLFILGENFGYKVLRDANLRQIGIWITDVHLSHRM